MSCAPPTTGLGSRLGQERKKAIESIHEHGSERTWVQVTANGLVGLTAAVLTTITEESAFLIAAVTSFAATNADTWGSEIGVLSRRTPRSILTGREVEPGMSGGVTLEGTIASLLGSVVIAVSLGLIGVLSQLLTGNPVTAAHVVRVAGTTSIVLVCGFVGSIIDSVLGASVQAQYRTGEGSVTERARGEDGPHTLVRGLRFMTNDVVNLLSAALASAAGAGLYLFVFR